MSRPVALITGAAHGQGRVTAVALAREGYDIVALDVARELEYPGYPMGSASELESLPAELEPHGAACLTVAADVRDDAAVKAGVAAAIERFGRIDVLFNNAGICGYGLAHELTEDAWDAMVDINLKGAWIVARHVIPHMIAARRGVIVNNSSIAGLRGMGRLSHYAASKWGLTGLTKSWAIELAPHGIRVVSVAPGAIETPINRDVLDDPEARREVLEEIPLGRWGDVADVAQAIAWVASDRASYVTGTTLFVDGGMTLYPRFV